MEEEKIPQEVEEAKLQELIEKRVKEQSNKFPSPTVEERRLFARCHPIDCPLAWMWPTWHPTPPHKPLYPTDWC